MGIVNNVDDGAEWQAIDYAVQLSRDEPSLEAIGWNLSCLWVSHAQTAVVLTAMVCWEMIQAVGKRRASHQLEELLVALPVSIAFH